MTRQNRMLPRSMKILDKNFPRSPTITAFRYIMQSFAQSLQSGNRTCCFLFQSRKIEYFFFINRYSICGSPATASHRHKKHNFLIGRSVTLSRVRLCRQREIGRSEHQVHMNQIHSDPKSKDFFFADARYRVCRTRLQMQFFSSKSVLYIKTPESRSGNDRKPRRFLRGSATRRPGFDDLF
jgi:hypothetical protein